MSRDSGSIVVMGDGHWSATGFGAHLHLHEGQVSSSEHRLAAHVGQPRLLS